MIRTWLPRATGLLNWLSDVAEFLMDGPRQPWLAGHNYRFNSQNSGR